MSSRVASMAAARSTGIRDSGASIALPHPQDLALQRGPQAERSSCEREVALVCLCGEAAAGIPARGYLAAPAGWLRHHIVEDGSDLAWCPSCTARLQLIVQQSRHQLPSPKLSAEALRRDPAGRRWSLLARPASTPCDEGGAPCR